MEAGVIVGRPGHERVGGEAGPVPHVKRDERGGLAGDASDAGAARAADDRVHTHVVRVKRAAAEDGGEAKLARERALLKRRTGREKREKEERGRRV